LVLDEMAAMKLVAVSRPQQRRLVVILDGLKTAPFRLGDFQQRDAAGRLHEVALIDDWLVTYWSDHAAREVRIVGLEQVED
jgi:hypothetical protein